MDNDIVSTSRESLEKFIRELYGLTNHMKILAKHVLETNSEDINMIDHKSILYNHNGWLFTLNNHIDLYKYEVVFGAKDIIAEDEDKYDKYDNYYVCKLSFVNKFTSEVFEVHEESNSQLYVSKQLFDVLLRHKYFNLEEKQVISIPLTEFNTKDPFVFLRVENEGLTKHINELRNFIQKGDKPLEGVESYNDLIEKLNMLFRLAKMNYPSVHIEMVARPLIRTINDQLQLPDWSKEQKVEDYKLISLHKSAITKNSVTAGLIFERIKKQLSSPLTYRKTGSSVNSLFFINE